MYIRTFSETAGIGNENRGFDKSIKNRRENERELELLIQKRRKLPSIDTWINSDKNCKELMEMGYLYDEILWGEDIDMLK